MKHLENIVETAFRNKPETRESNDVLWTEITKALCIQKGITNVDDLLINILNGDIPNSHTIVAAATNVRKRCPELKPTTNSTNRKMEIRAAYAQHYRNA